MCNLNGLKLSGLLWTPRAAAVECPGGPSRMPGDNSLSRMPGANYGNRWSLAIDLWQAPIQTLTGCAPSRSSSLRPDTLNSTLGIPVVVYLDWGPALVSLFLLWLWLGELRTSGFVISGGQVLPTTFKTQANLGLIDCAAVTTHRVHE